MNRKPGTGLQKSQPQRFLAQRYRLKEGVWVPKTGLANFSYSDGQESEARILEAVTNAKDRSVFSEELRHAITDWPSLYHLSAARANLLRPFTQRLANSHVLEVGAGCGAITRFLGEIGANITAVEGSFQRALTARIRTGDQKNVTVVCDNIQDFPTTETFEVILLIGVLEYARMYVGDQANGQTLLLKSLASMLKPNGILIVAIENQLGLKYFAGALEDHFGRQFYGINDQYGTNTAATFGREALLHLLDASGFVQQKWFYPFPDYKLPVSTLAADHLRPHADLSANLIAASPMADPQRPADPLFSLEAAWQVVARNGLVGDFANSFLVACGRSRESIADLVGNDLIAWHYSISRHPAFAKQAEFVASTGKEVNVRRARLRPTAAPKGQVHCEIADEPYVEGVNWWLELVKILNVGGWTVAAVAGWCRLWIAAVAAEMKLEPSAARDYSALIDGRYVDAVPFNLICEPSGHMRFIDQEWRLTGEIEFQYLIFRGLRDSLLRLSSVGKPAPDTPINIHRLIRAVFTSIGIAIADNDLRRFVELEYEFQKWVFGEKDDDVTPAKLDEALLLSLTVRGDADRQTLRGQAESRSVELQQMIEETAAIKLAYEDVLRERADFVAERERLSKEIEAFRSERAFILKERETFLEERDAVAKERTALDREHSKFLAERDVILKERKAFFAERDVILKEREAFLVERDAVDRERTALDQEHNKLLAERDVILKERKAFLAERDIILRERETFLAEREAFLIERDTLSREHEAVVRAYDGLVEERATFLKDRAALLQERDKILAESDVLRNDHEVVVQAQKEERDTVVKEVSAERDLLERERNVLRAALEKQTSQIASLKENLEAAPKGLLADFHQIQDRLARAIEENDARGRIMQQHLAMITKLQHELIQAKSEVRSFLESTSWRITAPLRMLKQKVKGQNPTRRATN